MIPLCLYCKSYRRDFKRLKRLLESIQRHNKDEIPCYISTPTTDKSLLSKIVGDIGYIWVSDEDIVATNPLATRSVVKRAEPYVAQSIIKAEFWRLSIAENYLCIDSDSKFLRDFTADDFITTDGMLYTVIHQNKELMQAAINQGYKKVVSQQLAELKKIQTHFQRQGPVYVFMPSPFLWSAKVWQSLADNLLLPQNKTLWHMLQRGLGEYHWYGEALLAYQAIKLLPVEPFFRVYHYDWQYFTLKRQGETEVKIAENFLGVIYQSNWEFNMDMDPSDKRPLSRATRSIKQYLRYLRSSF